MVSDLTLAWGAPGFDPAGAPDTDGDPQVVSEYFQYRTPREFTTVTALLASTPPGDHYSARAQNAPGALFMRVAGAWVMFGVPRFADASARDSALTAPVAGWISQLASEALTRRWNGTAWKEWESDWITWTTAPTNLNVGTGGSASSLQRYKFIAGRVYFEYKFVLGSSGASMGTAPTLNLPITLARLTPAGGVITVGDGAVYDLSAVATTNYTKAVMQSATTVAIQTIASGVFANITATAPITWAAGDILAGGFWGDLP